MKSNLTALIIAKNEEKMIQACLETLSFCQKIILVDNGSSDRTTSIAESYDCQVVSFSHESFAKLREKAHSMVETDWLFYVDADERVSPALAKEILFHIEKDDCQVMTIRRENICYGQQFNFGNWQNDLVTRVFKKENLLSWQGEIHESPLFKGVDIELQHQLIHLTHRNTQDNLRKSADWTIKEATALAAASVKDVNLLTILRKGTMEFYRRAIKYQGHKDGMAGIIEALVQAINRMIVYIQVWELQQKPSIKNKYEKKEQEIKNLWQREGKIRL
jgi:glycosyltransferase involved in cell wall biosynthesis